MQSLTRSTASGWASAAATLFVLTAALVAVGVPTLAFTATLAFATGICCVGGRRSGALLLGVTGWALCTGFGVNELGELTFAPGRSAAAGGVRRLRAGARR